MPGGAQVYLWLIQRRASVCQWGLKEGEKSLAQRARPEGSRFRRQRFPVVLATFGRLLAVMRRLFTIVLRLFTVVRRLFTIVLWLFTVMRWLFAVVLTVLRRWLPLVLCALAVMLCPFFRRRRRVICSKSP